MSEDGLSYEFNELIVVQDSVTKRLFYAMDSGCSCPTPFEDFYFNSAESHNFTPIEIHSWNNFENDVNNFPVTKDEQIKILGNIKATLRG